MIVSVCPAAEVAAPPERVWAFLAAPEMFERWADVRLVDAEPAGPVAPGQRLRFTSGAFGLRFGVTMEVGDVDAPRRLRLFIRLPFGIVNDETITISAMTGGGALVRFG
ncbi:MAG: SRPBCC family protein [Candidatus Dormibacteraeota bacterium]|nr:SRPBCC family protein [Candidatus Dormibacteraeota bacterium]